MRLLTCALGVPFTNGVRFLESRPAATPMPEARRARRPEERRAVRLGLLLSPAPGGPRLTTGRSFALHARVLLDLFRVFSFSRSGGARATPWTTSAHLPRYLERFDGAHHIQICPSMLRSAGVVEHNFCYLLVLLTNRVTDARRLDSSAIYGCGRRGSASLPAGSPVRLERLLVSNRR